MLSKNFNNKKCAPKLVLFNEKNEKDYDDFWPRELTLKIKLQEFSKLNNFLWVNWFLGKNISNFVPFAWKLNNWYYHILHFYPRKHSIFAWTNLERSKIVSMIIQLFFLLVIAKSEKPLKFIRYDFFRKVTNIY